ncbi:MAG: hypothetical protein QOI16_3721, partial [Pseudonocardiales bacterium]|nr:hypothetical protein [Pseudonocardiales bacterium]
MVWPSGWCATTPPGTTLGGMASTVTPLPTDPPSARGFSRR